MESIVENNACLTQIRVVKCNYKWVIDNFKYCCEDTGEFFKSSKFFAEECKSLAWSLRIYPKGINEEFKEYVSIYLHLESGNEPDIKANMKFSILDGEGKSFNCNENVQKKAFRCEQDTFRGVNNFISRDDLFNKADIFLPDNKLTILCEIDMVQRVNVNELGEIVEPINKVSSSVMLKSGDEFNKEMESNGLSDIKDKDIKLIYKLPIPTFVNSVDLPKVIESPTFYAPNIQKFQWFLRVYPEGLSNESVSVYLYLETNNEPEGGIKGRISIQDENEQQIVESSLRSMTYAPIQAYYAHFPKESLVKKDENLALNKNLTLICEIEIKNEDYKSDSNNNVYCINVPDELPINSENLFSDVILEVDGREFNAHKAILAAKSRFFAAKFDNETNEEKFNRIVISDVDYDVFREVLRFIYVGEAQNLKTVAVRLLAAAEKFSLEKLKIKCEEALTVRNSCQVLVQENASASVDNENSGLHCPI